MTTFFARTTLIRIAQIFLFAMDMIWKLWTCFLTSIVLILITLGISAYFADTDFQKLNVAYTDAMVPWMMDKIDEYMFAVFPWVLGSFLVLLILYKRYFK